MTNHIYSANTYDTNASTSCGGPHGTLTQTAKIFPKQENTILIHATKNDVITADEIAEYRIAPRKLVRLWREANQDKRTNTERAHKANNEFSEHLFSTTKAHNTIEDAICELVENPDTRNEYKIDDNTIIQVELSNAPYNNIDESFFEKNGVRNQVPIDKQYYSVLELHERFSVLSSELQTELLHEYGDQASTYELLNSFDHIPNDIERAAYRSTLTNTEIDAMTEKELIAEHTQAAREEQSGLLFHRTMGRINKDRLNDALYERWNR